MTELPPGAVSRGRELIMTGGRPPLHITATAGVDGCALTVVGVLHGSTYAGLRDTIIKAVLDEPRSLIIDVTGLTYRDESVLAVFTAARWQVGEWPDIPIGLVCAHQRGRDALQRNGIARYIPVYPTLSLAADGLLADGRRRYRRRARVTLPAVRGSARHCRELIREWLTAWSRTDFAHAVSIVATELVENALAETNSAISLRLETDGATVTVAVQHTSATHPHAPASDDTISGLDLVTGNCRVWGTYTTAAGTTVWAVVGPENRF